MSSLRSWGLSLVKLLIRVRFPNVAQISTAALASWLEQSRASQPLLLDARTFQEYGVSHLPQAKLVPNSLEDLTQWENLNSSTAIVVYCSVGYRSARLAQRLQEIGYTNVLNLSGSIFQWVNEGYPVEQQGKIVRQVHPYNGFWGYLLKGGLRSLS